MVAGSLFSHGGEFCKTEAHQRPQARRVLLSGVFKKRPVDGSQEESWGNFSSDSCPLWSLTPSSTLPELKAHLFLDIIFHRH